MKIKLVRMVRVPEKVTVKRIKVRVARPVKSKRIKRSTMLIKVKEVKPIFVNYFI
jgi:hypothetical protein